MKIAKMIALSITCISLIFSCGKNDSDSDGPKKDNPKSKNLTEKNVESKITGKTSAEVNRKVFGTWMYDDKDFVMNHKTGNADFKFNAQSTISDGKMTVRVTCHMPNGDLLSAEAKAGVNIFGDRIEILESTSAEMKANGGSCHSSIGTGKFFYKVLESDRLEISGDDSSQTIILTRQK